MPVPGPTIDDGGGRVGGQAEMRDLDVGEDLAVHGGAVGEEGAGDAIADAAAAEGFDDADAEMDLAGLGF